MRRVAVALMAKAPTAGAVKTRLTPSLTAADAAHLYRCFLIDKIEQVRALKDTHPVVAYTPLEASGVFKGLAGSTCYRVAWAGSRVRGRDRLTTWDGSLELSAGRIVDAVPFAMENPEKGIVERTDSRLRWISDTTGDDDGVDLTLAAPASAVLRFRPPNSLSITSTPHRRGAGAMLTGSVSLRRTVRRPGRARSTGASDNLPNSLAPGSLAFP